MPRAHGVEARDPADGNTWPDGGRAVTHPRARAGGEQVQLRDRHAGIERFDGSDRVTSRLPGDADVDQPVVGTPGEDQRVTAGGPRNDDAEQIAGAASSMATGPAPGGPATGLAGLRSTEQVATNEVVQDLAHRERGAIGVVGVEHAGAEAILVTRPDGALLGALAPDRDG